LGPVARSAGSLAYDHYYLGSTILLSRHELTLGKSRVPPPSEAWAKPGRA
jgi:hypothetical protein